MAFDLKRVLKVMLFASNGPLSVKDIQTAISRFHEQATTLPLVEQGAVLDELVAGEAGVGCAAPSVLGDEIIDHILLELLLEVEDVVRNIERLGDRYGIIDIFDRATLLLARQRIAIVQRPQPHGDADHLVSLLDQ